MKLNQIEIEIEITSIQIVMNALRSRSVLGSIARVIQSTKRLGGTAVRPGCTLSVKKSV